MSSRLYREHVIIPFPSFDTITNAWAPQADISWCSGSDRQFQFVRFPSRVATESEAISFAIRRGQAWVDHRLRLVRRTLSASAGRGRDRREPSKGNLALAQFASRQQPHALTVRRTPAKLIFDEFKNAAAQRGLKLDEKLLQKSYAALLKLGRHKHWSWSRTRDQLKHLQQPIAAHATSRRISGAPIPLTERAWLEVISSKKKRGRTPLSK